MCFCAVFYFAFFPREFAHSFWWVMRKYLLICSCLGNPFSRGNFEHSIITSYRLIWESTAALWIGNCSLPSLPSITRRCLPTAFCASELFVWWPKKKHLCATVGTWCPVPSRAWLTLPCFWVAAIRKSCRHYERIQFLIKNYNVLVSHCDTNRTCKLQQNTYV